ncbi:CapA family protein [Deinococcus alpinitundrae]|uniref:CapA family protein n=1 Tax=Deinococcus alpinitundrae TaxID=468913 RepID=UPI001379ABF3|nr:CapA family protein [Deinococcus alpinitundrae]
MRGRQLSRLILCAGLAAATGPAAPVRPTAPTLALAGDISLARTVRPGDPLRAVAAALRAEASYANLESPLTTAPAQTRGFDLRASPARVGSLRTLTQLGTENNHALDGGTTGQRQSRQMLRRHHLLPVTRTPQFSRVAGRQVAWLAFFDDGLTPPPLVALRRAATQARYVVVGVHWGGEYGPITERQRRLARQLAGAGATLVIGSGPHVLQGHELLGRTLILYSLGNLLLDQPFPSARIGAVVRLRLDHLHAACAVPTRYRAGQTELAHGEEAEVALARLDLPRCAL